MRDFIDGVEPFRVASCFDCGADIIIRLHGPSKPPTPLHAICSVCGSRNTVQDRIEYLGPPYGMDEDIRKIKAVVQKARDLTETLYDEVREVPRDAGLSSKIDRVFDTLSDLLYMDILDI